MLHHARSSADDERILWLLLRPARRRIRGQIMLRRAFSRGPSAPLEVVCGGFGAGLGRPAAVGARGGGAPPLRRHQRSVFIVDVVAPATWPGDPAHFSQY